MLRTGVVIPCYRTTGHMNRLAWRSIHPFRYQLVFPVRDMSMMCRPVGHKNLQKIATSVGKHDSPAPMRFASTLHRDIVPGRKDQLCESMLLHQEGTEIQEVPVPILRDAGEKRSDKSRLPFVQLKATEEAAFVDGFKNFHSPEEVLSLLHTIPSQEVTPVVALSILVKLLEVENNFVFKSDGKTWQISSECSVQDTFARKAIVSRLVDILTIGQNTTVLLDALDTLRSDRKAIATNVIRISEDLGDEHVEDQCPKEMFEFSKYRAQLCEEVLIRITKGQLSLEQTCRAVCTIGKIVQLFPGEVETDFVDKMWIGISEKSDNIGEENIAQLFETIQYFKKSQRLVMTIATQKLLNLSWKLDTATIAQICESLLMRESQKGLFGTQYWGIVSARLLASISKILHANLHQLTEVELVKITKTFHALDYHDHIFEKTLSKYMKARCLKLSNSSTVVTVMDYVRKNRIRSTNILDAVAEYIVLYNSHDDSTQNHSHRTQQLTPTEFCAVLIPFGYLDYQPQNGTKFWAAVEHLLFHKFAEIPPRDVIDSLLSCIYLQKYPLNFVHRIFSTYFLDRLHTTEGDMTQLQQTRSSLKLLDTALALECGPKYEGPYLPRDFVAKSLFLDGRISRMRSYLQETLTSIYSPTLYKIESSVVLPNLPLHRVYIIDILISPRTGTMLFESLDDNDDDKKGTSPPSIAQRSRELHPNVALRNRFNFRDKTGDHYHPIKQSSDYKAILINIPEHFASDRKSLLGLEIMRKRHLKLLGFTVINLSYDTLSSLKTTQHALTDYIQGQIKS